MMKLLAIGLLAVLLASGTAYALSYSEQECMKSCCESGGGTYYWEHNGCENPPDGYGDCADSCREPESPATCAFSMILLPGLALGALAARTSGKISW
jgi:hypothetical protein